MTIEENDSPRCHVTKEEEADRDSHVDHPMDDPHMDHHTDHRGPTIPPEHKLAVKKFESHIRRRSPENQRICENSYKT
jgi:hypothetical protein